LSSVLLSKKRIEEDFLSPKLIDKILEMTERLTAESY